MTRVPTWRRTAFVAAVALLAAAAAWACSVPVFRYALERWPADAYHAVVFHRGPLSTEQSEVVHQLSSEGLAGALFSNVETHLVDLEDDLIPELQTLWLAQRTNALPWLAVTYPPAANSSAALWTGPLKNAPIRELLDSPARKEVAKRLIQGQSGVWVLLEIGDQTRDAEAEKLLQERLNYLADVLELPTLKEEDISAGLVSVPQEALSVSFSILRISRDDPTESLFARMLLGTEDDLKALKEPMAFPVFGRGRALYALVGKGINNETIDEACAFLIGACSCQVKELNPGVDLLLSADWDNLVQTAFNADRELPPLTGLVGFDDDDEGERKGDLDPEDTSPATSKGAEGDVSSVAETAGDSPTPAAPSSSSGGVLLNSALVAGVGLVVVLGISVFFFRKIG